MSKMQLVDIEPYGSLVQRLDNLEAYLSSGPFYGRWYSTLDEARADTLAWYTREKTRYKRNCEGLRQAQRNIEVLQSPPAH